MKKTLRRWSILLTIIFSANLFCPGDVFAKQTGSRSFSSRSRSRSYSSKGSGSRTKGSFSGPSGTTTTTTYTSRSRIRSKKGSLFNASSKKTTRGTSLADAARKADSKSKFIASTTGQQRTSKTYRQVVADNKALRDALTLRNLETREARRKIFYLSFNQKNTYYNYSPGNFYNDPFDNVFFQYVSLIWVFHHWPAIDKSRFDAATLQELEAKIEQMEQERRERDPNYVMPGVDPDLQYSDEELADLQEAKDVIEMTAEQKSSEGGFGWLTLFLMGLVIVGGIYFVAVRRY